MSNLSSMPVSGVIVIVVILILFILAVIMLLACARATGAFPCLVADNQTSGNDFLRYTTAEFAAAYKRGADVNTPAIISNAVGAKLSGALFCERFLNSAVSLFVTLGLFGTFLGLSHSVASLTELISFSNTSEWLSVLDSVGGGLMSSLSGMGVAFYTSLVGVACSIVLTLLRAAFNPETLRQKLETQLELWLGSQCIAHPADERRQGRCFPRAPDDRRDERRGQQHGAQPAKREQRAWQDHGDRARLPRRVQQDRGQLQRRRARLLRSSTTAFRARWSAWTSPYAISSA